MKYRYYFGRENNYRTRKVPVMGILQRGGDVRLSPIADVRADTLASALRQNVAPSATLMTDGSPAYTAIGREFPAHQHVNRFRGYQAAAPLKQAGSGSPYFPHLHAHPICGRVNIERTMTITHPIRAALRAPMYERRLTPAATARLAGMHASNLYDYLHERGELRTDTLERLMAALGLHMALGAAPVAPNPQAVAGAAATRGP